MYTDKYDQNEIRGWDSSFPQFVIPKLNRDMKLLDLGCGTCRKLIQYAPHVSNVFGIDRNSLVLNKGKQKIQQKGIRNIVLLEEDNMILPFPSHIFDVCTTSLTTWSPSEVHRVLKTGGLLFVELLAWDDKETIKRAFGKDDIGWRGRFLNQSSEEHWEYMMNGLRPFFKIIQVKEERHKTILSKNGLITLLEQTPTIRGFNKEKDRLTIDTLSKDERIEFEEHRFFIYANGK